MKVKEGLWVDSSMMCPMVLRRRFETGLRMDRMLTRRTAMATLDFFLLQKRVWWKCADYCSPTGRTPTMQTAQSDGLLFTMQPTRDILLW